MADNRARRRSRAGAVSQWTLGYRAGLTAAAERAEKYADDLPNETTEQTATRGAVRFAADAIRALGEKHGSTESQESSSPPAQTGDGRMSTIKVITREAYDHLAEQCEALQSKLARRDALLEQIHSWCQAYPLDVFPEPDFEKARWALEQAGISLGAVSASNMRHVLNGIEQMIRKELSGQNEKEAG